MRPGGFMRALMAGAALLGALATVPARAQPTAGASPPAGGNAAASAGPEARYALVIGQNEGNDPDHTLRYAQADAERVARVLEQSANLKQLELLVNTSAAAVDAALRAMRARIDTDRAAGRSTMFLFYYSGHGDQNGLELGPGRLPLHRVREYLESLPADVKIAFLDACQSGSLTGIKGGKLAPAYEVRLADPAGARGLAVVTSSTASELSQESDELKASFFSHAVLSGLRGAADTSGDGQVTLGEVYHYAFRRTVTTTATSPMGGQHPTYDYRMAGVGDVVLTRVRRSDARLVFPHTAPGTFLVLAGDEVTAEVATASDGDRYVALPAGRYRVLRRHDGNVTEGRVVLAARDVREVDPATMVVAEDLPTFSKGGPPENNLLGAEVQFQSSVLRGTGVFVGAVGPVYQRRFEAFNLGASVVVSRFDANDRGYASSVLRVQPGLALRRALWQRRAALIALGLQAALPLARQSDGAGAEGWSIGAGYGGTLILEAPVAASVRLLLDLSGGGETFRLNGAVATRATFGLALGLGWGF